MTIHPDYIIFNTSLQTVKLLYFFNNLIYHENFVNKWSEFESTRHS